MAAMGMMRVAMVVIAVVTGVMMMRAQKFPRYSVSIATVAHLPQCSKNRQASIWSKSRQHMGFMRKSAFLFHKQSFA
ncbi:hypothetical protein [Novosphingobium sp. TH158]|uniref:hypothetical protein n=1 Tax=Novosphingobium sp. TH158 TaxID=2067455 RepID=UPI000C7A6ECA|nr:hypothetical protein [Novosphingobium sp. TH158]PLK26854.1 hypothetical protein C0V78_08085 [Novosphingobium sp. TH158]